MRRYFVIALLLMLLLSGCAAGKEQGSTSATMQPSSPVVQPPQVCAWEQFLTEVNRSGEVDWSQQDGPAAPGALPQPEWIPAADQSRVGQTVHIRFSQEQPAVRFYYAVEAELERLAVIVPAESLPLLIVFETNLGGAEALREKLANQQPIEAKILAMVNVCYEEGNEYAYNACRDTAGLADGELLDISTPSTVAAGRYLGVFGNASNGDAIAVLKGSAASSASEALEEDFTVFWRIITRFTLDTHFSA